MAFRSFFLLVLAIVSVKGEEVVFKKCRLNDFECVKIATEEFVAQTYGGNSKYGVDQLDPLIISSLDLDLAKDYGLKLHYKNVNITGFKDLKLTAITMKGERESLSIQADLSIETDADIEITKVEKTFKGTVYANTKFAGTAEYDLSMKEIDGKQYFIVGPETLSCEIIGEPTVTLGNDLMTTMYKDEDVIRVKSDWESNITTMRKKILCEIANKGLAKFINNTRNLAQVLDKDAFLLNE